MAVHKIAIIVGSLREGSINRKIARSICALRDDNLDCSIVEIGDLPLFNQDYERNPPEQWVRFKEQIAAVDGILFCTPEYNRGMPGVLKNAIDVGSRPYGRSVWDRKPAAIVSASPGIDRRSACQPSAPPVLRVPQHAGDAAAGGLSRPRQ